MDVMQGYRVCFACTQSRQAAAMDHRCHCGVGRRRISELHEHYSRKWYSCLRCLGTVEQIA
jgi:hypothetical protein